MGFLYIWPFTSFKRNGITFPKLLPTRMGLPLSRPCTLIRVKGPNTIYVYRENRDTMRSLLPQTNCSNSENNGPKYMRKWNLYKPGMPPPSLAKRGGGGNYISGRFLPAPLSEPKFNCRALARGPQLMRSTYIGVFPGQVFGADSTRVHKGQSV